MLIIPSNVGGATISLWLFPDCLPLLRWALG